MAERPHSRKVTIAEGCAQVKKGEKIDAEMRASQRTPSGEEKDSKRKDEED